MALADIYEALSYIPDGRPDLKLDMTGEIENWSTETSTGVVSHRVLRRSGAVHQQPLIPPRRFTWKGVLIGGDVKNRYRALSDTIRAFPFGIVIHPRLSSLQVAVEVMSDREAPGEALDCIEYELRMEESGLRDPPKPSPAALSGAAISRADALIVRAAADAPTWSSQAGQLRTSALGFSAMVAQSASSAAGLLDLQASLRTVRAALESLAPAPYFLRVEATQVFADCLASYNRILAGRPPIVVHTVTGAVTLPRLCAALFGGKVGRQVMPDIRALNPPIPVLLSPGLTLLIPDVDSAKRSSPTL